MKPFQKKESVLRWKKKYARLEELFFFWEVSLLSEKIGEK